MGRYGCLPFATGSKPVTREEAFKLYNTLENLCISRGIPMPNLRIIETEAANAFASGLKQRDYAITVTRGLIDTRPLILYVSTTVIFLFLTVRSLESRRWR